MLKNTYMLYIYKVAPKMQKLLYSWI